MSTPPDPNVKAAFDRIVARAPEPGPTPSPQQHRHIERSSLKRHGLVAIAASVAALGVAGLARVATTDGEPAGPAASPTVAPLTPESTTPSPPESGPLVETPGLSGPSTSPPDTDAPSMSRGAPTLLPVLDAVAADAAPVTGDLRYPGAAVQPKVNAVIGRMDADGSTSDQYTFVAGPGVHGYTDGLGISTESSTPEVTDVMGYGYAAWTTNDVPVLVMAANPMLLLDDPAFEMTVSIADDNIDASISFPSLPAGFEVIVEPQRFAGEAATAVLFIGVTDDPYNLPGTVSASLDNPLTNLNLIEGSTITPSQVGDVDAWIVSSPGTDHRAVVWNPNGSTWVAVNWAGSQSDLLAIAEAVSFTSDIGEWMSRYDVALPPIEFDGSSPSG